MTTMGTSSTQPLADLASPDPQLRRSAAEAVTTVDEAGLDLLVGLLADSDAGVRRAAVDALIRLRKPGTNDRIRSLVEHSDIETRKAALEVALRVGSAGASKTPGTGRGPSPAGRLVPMALAFAAGLVTTVALGALGLFVGRFGNTPAKVIAGMLLFSVLLLAMKGWAWMSEYEFGSYGHALKFLALLFIMMTGVGLVPTVYWVGRGVGQLLNIAALGE